MTVDRTFFIDRAHLFKVLGDRAVVCQFEEMQQKVATTDEASVANVEATEVLKDATYITLSANAELPNERVLQLAEGLSFDLLTAGVVKIVPDVSTTGGWPAQFVTTGITSISLPLSGTLATTGNSETLSNKTLAAPKVSGLGDYADDAAAAAGGVPVTGLYRNGSALQVRVA